MVDKGFSKPEIAKKKGVCLRTIQRHVKRLDNDTKPRENGQFYKENGVLTTGQPIKPSF